MLKEGVWVVVMILIDNNKLLLSLFRCFFENVDKESKIKVKQTC